MGHAWLDSLSEDWVSQPGSPDASFAEASPSPDARLPKPITPSRIPRLSPHARKFQNAVNGHGSSNTNSANKSGNNNNSSSSSSSSSSNVLGERNINERVAALSRRTPSKLSQEISASGRDCQACRSASASTTNSVVRNTVHRRSMNASQSKGKGGETPEWKRRLVYGDLSYGEQKDLFTSAGTGLESIFKPPQSRGGDAERQQHTPEGSRPDAVAPSSPRRSRRNPSTAKTHVEDSAQQPPHQAQKRSRPEGSIHVDTCAHRAPGANGTALSQGSEGGSRKVSGRSDVRNEDFSPIIIERRQTSNGATTFSPADLPADELRKRLETLRHDQVLVSGDAHEGSVRTHAASRATETAPDLARLEGFVNFQRGGLSEDGSFRNRMLSSALNDSSELNPEESLQASTPKQFPTVRVEHWDSSGHLPADSPDLPRAPDPSPEKRLAPVHLTTGSPLKLFQPYDTFTNQTLLRRLSQMHEEPGDSHFSIAADPDSGLPADSPHRLLPPADHAASSQMYANRFGAGELDGYEFNDEFSHITHDATGLDGDKENRDPEDSMLPPRSPIFNLTNNSSPAEVPELVINRRRKSSGNPLRRPARASMPGYFDLASPSGGRRDLSGPEIKRPRTSPSKAPTPKRRRTLHKSDISYGTQEPESGLDSVQLSHHQMRSALGRSRREACDDLEHDTPAHEARQSLRPWTPSPSQRSSQRERQPFAEIDRSPLRSSRHSRPPTALPAGAAVDADRKPSIKTEDFINEANKIMAMIRSKAGLATGLASVEESDEDKGQPSPELDGSFEESTQEPFSRPPSREGRPPLTRMSTKQEDPVLAEQLKKYEEASEMGDLIGSSVRSARLAQAALSAARERRDEWDHEQSQVSEQGDEVVSDPPNMRISRNPDWHEEPAAQDLGNAVPSQGSAGVSTQSTGLSFPTGSSRNSSRGSEARKTIMPESVCHLIPDQVGDMVLDRQRNMWVKRKGSGEPRQSFTQSVMSEDDPFAGIPDLSVDVTKEMQNLLLARKNEAALPGGLSDAAPASPSRPPRMGSLSRAGFDWAERSMRGQMPSPGVNGMRESQAREPRRLTISFSSPVASVIQDAAGIHDMLSEGAAHAQSGDLPDRGRGGAHRASTQHMPARSRSNSRGPPRHLSVRGKSMMARPVSRIDERDEDSVQEAAHGMELSILGDCSVANRDGGSRQASLSLLVATPVRRPSCPAAGVDAAPVISQYVGAFSLSPLSEFTIHRPDETLPLEASYVVDNHRFATGDPSKRAMSMSVRALVDKLAEVEPFEPYWEDMRELDLRGKGLSALQALDEYCGQLESLDASKNQIRNLGGIPSSVLNLRMADNQLSSLTAWNHLIHLQYVDVSNNGLTSLSALKGLIHLRTLRADNNQIASLDGIKYHKGLQTLRARGNLLEDVDFAGSTLHQLTELDLKNNRIARVAHVGQLASLSALNLDGNCLTAFSVDAPEPMTALRYLRLDDNQLADLDVHNLPHLRLLHADRNRLAHVAGFSRARRIDSLSLREQRGDAPLDVPRLLARAYEVRKLYLSGNFIGGGGGRPSEAATFAPRVDMLNLQLLELANCGLSSLPADLGLALPNLRVLNLNMNALADLAPLRGVPRLKKLYAVGNRLADPARLLDVLGGMKCLAVVDLRDNPLTQGFYAPGMQRRVVVRRSSSSRRRPGAICGGEDIERHGDAEGDGKGDRAGVYEGGEEEEAAVEQFALPDQDAECDARYCARLDMDTRVRRRLYETMLAKRCGRVRRLDGLVLRAGGRRVEGAEDPEGAEGAEGTEGDVVWLAMAEKGLVKSMSGEKRDVGGHCGKEGEDEEERERERPGDASGRWPAEDSFA